MNTILVFVAIAGVLLMSTAFVMLVYLGLETLLTKIGEMI